jgi:hypothetical protein
MAASRSRLYSVLLLGAATTATALLTAACNGTATVANGGSTTTVKWSTVPNSPSNSSAGGAGQTTTNATRQKLQFPNTSLTVRIQGYDSTTRMVIFSEAKLKQVSADTEPVYADDPGHPGNHRLPLAANARINTIVSLCRQEHHDDPVDMNGKPCTAQQFVAGLRTGDTAPATIHVDATDHIDVLKELYAP